MAADAEGMNFGPQWLRQLSDGNSLSSPPPNTTFCGFMSKHKPPKYNYNREEMLQLCHPKQNPPKYIKKYPEILSETVQKPWCGTKITPSEQRSLNQGVNSYSMLRRRGDGRMGPDSSRGRGKTRYGEAHQLGDEDETDEKESSDLNSSKGRAAAKGLDSGWRTAYRSRPCQSSESGGSGGLSNEGDDDEIEYEHSNWRAPSGRYFYSSRERTPSENDVDWRRKDKPADDGPRTFKHPPNWRQRSTSSGTYSNRGFPNWNSRHFRRNSNEPSPTENGELPEWSLSDVEIQATGCFDASGTFISTDNDDDGGELLLDDWEKDFDEENSFSTETDGKYNLPNDMTESPNRLDEVMTRTDLLGPNSLADSGLDGCDSANKSSLEQFDVVDNENGVLQSAKQLGVSEVDLVRAVDDLLQDGRGVLSPGVSMAQTFPHHSSINPCAYFNSEGLSTNSLQPSFSDTSPDTINSSLNESLRDTSTKVIENHWFYLDPKNQRQGPFTDAQMLEWYKSGYFQQNLLIKRQFDEKFSPLAAYLQHYKSRMFTPADSDHDNFPSFVSPHLPTSPMSFGTPRNIPLPTLGRSLSDGNNSCDLNMAAARLNLGDSIDLSSARQDVPSNLIGSTSTPVDANSSPLAALTLLLAQRQQQQQQQQQQQFIQQQLLQLMQQPTTLTQNSLALTAYLSIQQAALLNSQQSATSPMSPFFSPPGSSNNNTTNSITELTSNTFSNQNNHMNTEALNQPPADSSSFYQNYSPQNASSTSLSSLNQVFNNSNIEEANKFPHLNSRADKSDDYLMNFDGLVTRQQQQLAPGANYQSWIPSSQQHDPALTQPDVLQQNKFSGFDENGKNAWSQDSSIKVANNGDGDNSQGNVPPPLLSFLSGEKTLECSQLERQLFAQSHHLPAEGTSYNSQGNSDAQINNVSQQIKPVENSDWQKAILKSVNKNSELKQNYSNVVSTNSHRHTTAAASQHSHTTADSTQPSTKHFSHSSRHKTENSSSINRPDFRQGKQIYSSSSRHKNTSSKQDVYTKSLHDNLDPDKTTEEKQADSHQTAVKELKDWFLLALEGMQYSEHVDINTLVELLLEIESPFEVEDILQDNLGSSPRIPQLTKLFLEKRLQCRQKASHLTNSIKAHASTASSNHNDQWFAANSAAGRRKSKKKRSPNCGSNLSSTGQ